MIAHADADKDKLNRLDRLVITCYNGWQKFSRFISKINEDRTVLRSAQVLKQEAEEMGLQGKDIAEYVTRQQTLDKGRNASTDRSRREEKG